MHYLKPKLICMSLIYPPFYIEYVFFWYSILNMFNASKISLFKNFKKAYFSKSKGYPKKSTNWDPNLDQLQYKKNRINEFFRILDVYMRIQDLNWHKYQYTKIFVKESNVLGVESVERQHYGDSPEADFPTLERSAW